MSQDRLRSARSPSRRAALRSCAPNAETMQVCWGRRKLLSSIKLIGEGISRPGTRDEHARSNLSSVTEKQPDWSTTSHEERAQSFRVMSCDVADRSLSLGMN